MRVGHFAFDFTYKSANYSVQVKRFSVDKEIHLWTVGNRPGQETQIFTVYEEPAGSGGGR